MSYQTASRYIEDSDASCYIQWKGTDVCIDFLCPCGISHHYDGYFMYAIKCMVCGTVFETGTQVRFTKITDPQEIEDLKNCTVELDWWVDEY